MGRDAEEEIAKSLQDHIFDKVFRGVYQKEIDGFDPGEIKNDYQRLYDDCCF
jgi:hypothetical protein